jgi:hypothetical protein
VRGGDERPEADEEGERAGVVVEVGDAGRESGDTVSTGEGGCWSVVDVTTWMWSVSI